MSQPNSWSLASLLSLLIISVLLVNQCHAASYAPSSYTATQLSDDSVRKEILSLLRRVATLVHYTHPGRQQFLKRNGGTADSLFNLPDLMDIGRRR